MNVGCATVFKRERERESEGRRRGGREGKRRRKKKKKTEGGTSREFLTVVVINGSRWRIVKKKRSRVKVGLVERRLYVRHFVFMWPLSAGYIYVALSDSRCIRWYGIPREYISSVSETISREITLQRIRKFLEISPRSKIFHTTNILLFLQNTKHCCIDRRSVNLKNNYRPSTREERIFEYPFASNFFKRSVISSGPQKREMGRMKRIVSLTVDFDSLKGRHFACD